MNGIYEGKRVLEISDEKGMYCGKLLAEAGMEVIKIEPEGGDPQRLWGPFAGGIEDKERGLFWIYYNAGKKSITLDISSPEGQSVFKELAKDADIIIETLPVGEMAKYGLAYDDIRAINKKIIYCSMSPFGQNGPYAKWNSSSDMLAFAMAGNMYEAGLPGMNYEPLNIGRNFVNTAACCYAAVAILAYLRRVSATGEGIYIDTAAIEVAGLWKNEALANPQRFPYLADRKKTGSAGPFPPTGLFTCKDGGVYLVGMALWGPLADWMKEVGMDIGEFDGEKYRLANNANVDIMAHADEIMALVTELCSHYTKAELYNEGIKRHIPIVPMYSPQEVCEEEHYNERGYFVETDHPVAGKTKYPGAPARFTKTPLKVGDPAPLLGADNAEILGN